MELLLLPSRAANARPLLLGSSLRRRAGTATPAASSSNVEVIDTAASASTLGAAKQEWRAGGLGLDLSAEMRRGMMWRMLAPPAAAVAADAAFLRLLDRAEPGAVPGWAAAVGSAVLFVAGLLGVHYGFLSSRWDAAEGGSVVGWDLAVQHWNVLSMAKQYSLTEEAVEDDDHQDEDDQEDVALQR